MDKKYQFGDVEVEVPEFDFKKVLPVFFIALLLFLGYNRRIQYRLMNNALY